MKKILFFGLISCLTIFLSSCSKKETDISVLAQKNTESEESPVTSVEAVQILSEENTFVHSTEFIEYKSKEAELFESLPKVVRKDVLPKKGDVLVPFREPGTHIKWGTEPETFSIEDAVLAFTCNDAVVYSNPTVNDVTSEIIEKHTFLAWLYSEEKDSEFVPVKLFSNNSVSEIKYIKKDDIWSNEMDIIILYLYKQYMQVKDTIKPEIAELYRMYLNEAGIFKYDFEQLSTNLLRKEHKALINFRRFEFKKRDSFEKKNIDGSSIQKQINRLKEVFSPEEYYYYLSKSDTLRTNWVCDLHEKNDSFHGIKYFDMEMQMLPAETVFVKEKKNRTDMFWYYDEKENTIEQVSCHFLMQNPFLLYHITDCFDILELLDNYRNGNLNEQEKKDIICKINESMLQNVETNQDIVALASSILRGLEYDYSLHTENIYDIQSVDGTFVIYENTPLLSQPGTVGDVLTTLEKGTEITPEKAALVYYSDGWEGWYNLYYVYVEKDDMKGWVSAYNVTVKTGTSFASIHCNVDIYNGYCEENSRFGSIDIPKESVDITEIKYSEPYEDSYNKVTYELTDSPFGTDITVYADSSLTQEIGTIPDLTVVMTDGQVILRSWRGFGGDGGVFEISRYIFTDSIKGWSIKGWVSAGDLYSK